MRPWDKILQSVCIVCMFMCVWMYMCIQEVLIQESDPQLPPPLAYF